MSARFRFPGWFCKRPPNREVRRAAAPVAVTCGKRTTKGASGLSGAAGVPATRTNCRRSTSRGRWTSWGATAPSPSQGRWIGPIPLSERDFGWRSLLGTRLSFMVTSAGSTSVASSLGRPRLPIRFRHLESHHVLGPPRLSRALCRLYARRGRRHYEFDMLQHGPVLGLTMRV